MIHHEGGKTRGQKLHLEWLGTMTTLTSWKPPKLVEIIELQNDGFISENTCLSNKALMYRGSKDEFANQHDKVSSRYTAHLHLSASSTCDLGPLSKLMMIMSKRPSASSMLPTQQSIFQSGLFRFWRFINTYNLMH